MSRRFHIAAKQLTGAISAYAKRFDYLEVHLPRSGDPQALSPATLRRWRKQVPPHFEFGVVVGPAAALLRPGAALDTDVAAAQEAAAILQARCIVLRTPRDVTPTQLNVDRLAKLADRFPRDVTHLVWEPQGVWEVDAAAVVAKKLGLVLAVDPTRDPVPSGPVAYLRLRALGETRSFGAAALERVSDAVGSNRRDAYFVIETASALAECKTLRRLASQPRGARDGGMARLVRPRPLAVKVKDDEQE